MKFDFNKMTEKEIMNRWLLQGWSIASALLSVAYGVKGFIVQNMSIGVAAMIILVLNVPLFGLIATYRKHKDTIATGIAFPIAYGLAALIIMYCSRTPLTILYLMPMIVLIMSYTHTKIMTLMSIITFVGCSIILGLNTKIQKTWEVTTEEKLVYYAGLIATCLFCIISVKVAKRISDHKLEVTNEQSDRIKEIVIAANEIAVEVNRNATTSVTHLDEVEVSAGAMVQAMTETVAGMDNVRQIIESQLNTVKEIEEQTGVVSTSASNISEQAQNTNTEFENAHNKMTELMHGSQKMGDITGETIGHIAELSEAIQQVSNIVELINSIAAQTRLLSLNASIEAARAGDAGRGFSVVADEIGKLAAQTGDATADITTKIDALTSMFGAVYEKVEGLIEISEEQRTGIQTVNETFEVCKQRVTEIDTEAKKQNVEMVALQDRNNQMTEYIEQLSAVDEQVYANALTTSDLVKTSVKSIEEVEKILKDTEGDIKRLVDVLNK